MRGIPKHLNTPQDLLNVYDIDPSVAMAWIACLEDINKQVVLEKVITQAAVEYKSAVTETIIDKETGQEKEVIVQEEVLSQDEVFEMVDRTIESRNPHYYEFKDVIDLLKKIKSE
ncbi:MAG: hypothetical protein GY760_26545 [Deltaproteobacteria bacterium]|nr:hypothetical protein [Deltaproteobacteria bacterium]